MGEPPESGTVEIAFDSGSLPDSQQKEDDANNQPWQTITTGAGKTRLVVVRPRASKLLRGNPADAEAIGLIKPNRFEKAPDPRLLGSGSELHQ